MASLLFADHISINEHIQVMIPRVGDIVGNDEYFDAVFTVIATPYDMMVQLDDIGIDFTTIKDFDLFLLMYKRLQGLDTSLLFGDLKIGDMHTVVNEQNGEYLLEDESGTIRIDRFVHDQICRAIRQILSIEKNTKRPANDEAKKYMLERARAKLRRQRRKPPEPQLENYVVALVNTESFPYNYETVKNITIYQFYASLGQIAHKIQFDHLMGGYYAGTIKGEDLKPADKTWIKKLT